MQSNPVTVASVSGDLKVNVVTERDVDALVRVAFRGERGVGIASIVKTGTAGLVDTYTITYDNGDTSTFDLTNGQDGADGADGYSPTATVSKSGDTATITITDINGTTTTSISDGAGGTSVFETEYGVATYADVKDAYDADEILVCTVDDSGNKMVLQLVYFDNANEIFFFAFPTSDGLYWTQLSNADGWDDGTFYFASTDVATQLADGLMSALDKQKLDGLSKRNIWYGTCSTSASQSPKAITTASGDFSLTAGNMLCVLFSHTNSLSSVSLQVDGGTSKSAYSMDGTSDISNRWGSNEVVMFVYDGTKFVMLEQGMASTTQYGITKLNNTTSSTSTSEAATANAVKAAYDNGGVQSVNGSTGAVSLSIPSTAADVGAVPLDSGGNISISGGITVGGHQSAIGYRSAASNTKSLSSGTSSVQINGEDLTLSAGTWVLVGSVDFPANATGVRNIRWNKGSEALNNTLVTVKAADGGFNTRLQTTAFVNLTESSKMYLYGFQNSGSSLTVTWYWQIVRIA